MKETVYSINDNYSEITGLRTCNISDFSGEHFYHKFLNELFYESVKNNEILVIDLDSGRGYAPSFIDESFGNLVYDFSKKLVDSNFKLLSDNNPNWYDFFASSKEKWESRRLNNEEPKKTVEHDGWYRFRDGDFVKQIWLRS